MPKRELNLALGDKEEAGARRSLKPGSGRLCFQVNSSRGIMSELVDSPSSKRAGALLSPGEFHLSWAKLGLHSPWPGTDWPEKSAPGPAPLRAGSWRCPGRPEATLGRVCWGARRGSGLLQLMATLEYTTTKCWGQEQSFLGLRDSC